MLKPFFQPCPRYFVLISMRTPAKKTRGKQCSTNNSSQLSTRQRPSLWLVPFHTLGWARKSVTDDAGTASAAISPVRRLGTAKTQRIGWLETAQNKAYEASNLGTNLKLGCCCDDWTCTMQELCTDSSASSVLQGLIVCSVWLSWWKVLACHEPWPVKSCIPSRGTV